MLRARALTTSQLLPFSASPHWCCQGSTAGLFLLMMETRNKPFPPSASVVMLWHPSWTSATWAVGKEHAPRATATRLAKNSVSWACGIFSGWPDKTFTALNLLQSQWENAVLEIKPWLAQRSISPSHTMLEWTVAPEWPCCWRRSQAICTHSFSFACLIMVNHTVMKITTCGLQAQRCVPLHTQHV